MPSRRTKASAVNERISQAQKERTHLACVLCRSRRIKCDGRPGTCGRCLADQRTDCKYENVGLAERLAGRKRKRALRKQTTGEGQEGDGSTSLSASSSKPSSSIELKREASSSVSSTSTTPPLRLQSEILQRISVPSEEDQRSKQKQFQHHYHHLLRHHHYSQSRQDQQTDAWSPTLLSSSGPSFSLDENDQGRHSFHPSMSSSVLSTKIYSTEAFGYEVPLSSNGMLSEPSVLSKHPHFASDTERSHVYMPSSQASSEGSCTPTAWLGRSTHQIDQPYQAQHYSSYPTSQADSVPQFTSHHPHQSHSHQQQHQHQQRHQQFSEQQQSGRSGVPSTAAATGMPEHYLGNADLDLSSVDALWRNDDWQYRCGNGNSNNTRDTDYGHESQAFASVNAMMDPRIGLIRGSHVEYHGSQA